MAEQVQKVTLKMVLEDIVSGPSEKISRALENVNKKITSINRGPKGLFGGAAEVAEGIGIAAAFEKVAELTKKSLELAREDEQGSARLAVALDGNLTRIEEIHRVAEEVARSTIFSEGELSDVAQSLLERGVAFEKIPQAMKVIADTASALRKPISEVAIQIATLFGGTVPKELGRAVPALKNLSVEALKSGAALDVLNQRYRGRAEAFAATEPGKEIAALRDIQQAWLDIGKAIIPIERDLLPRVARGLKLISQVFDAKSLVTSQDVTDDLKDRAVVAVAGVPLAIAGMVLGSNPSTNPKTQQSESEKRMTAILEQQRKQLLADQAADAEARIPGLIADVAAGAKPIEAERSVESKSDLKTRLDEEYKIRLISLKEYLEKQSDLVASERDLLSAELERSRNKFSVIGEAIAGKSEKLKDPNTALDERQHLLKQIADGLQQQKDLEDEINRLMQAGVDLEQKRVDLRIKAIGESPAQTKKIFENYQGGLISADDLQSQIRQQIDDIAEIVNQGVAEIGADKIFTDEQKAALIARIQLAGDEATATIRKTVSSIRDISLAVREASEQLDDAAKSGISNTLLSIETRSKSVKAALVDMVKGFAEAILNVINQRLAERLVGQFDSGVKGGGVFSTIASAILGGIFHGGAGSGELQNLGDGAFVTSLEPNAAGTFASGGYTGDGDTRRIAGLVHRGEVVLNAQTVRRLGGASATQFAINRMLSYPSKMSSAMGISGSSGGASRDLVDAINQLSEIHSRPIPVAMPVNEETADQLFNHPQSPRIIARMMSRNPSIFSPAIRSLNPQK